MIFKFYRINKFYNFSHIRQYDKKINITIKYKIKKQSKNKFIMKKNFNVYVKKYLRFVYENNFFIKKKKIDYEFQIERLFPWSSVEKTKSLNQWFLKKQKNNKATIQFIHLEKMKKWFFNKKKRFYWTLFKTIFQDNRCKSEECKERG